MAVMALFRFTDLEVAGRYFNSHNNYFVSSMMVGVSHLTLTGSDGPARSGIHKT